MTREKRNSDEHRAARNVARLLGVTMGVLILVIAAVWIWLQVKDIQFVKSIQWGKAFTKQESCAEKTGTVEVYKRWKNARVGSSAEALAARELWEKGYFDCKVERSARGEMR